MSRKLARGLLIVAVFALLAGLSIAGNYVAYGLSSFPSPPAAQSLSLHFWRSFRSYLPWAMVTPGIVWLSRKVPLTGRRWRRAIAVHLLVPVLGSAPFFAFTIALNAAVGDGLPPVDFLASFWWRILLMEIVVVLPVYWLVLGAATSVQVYRDHEANQLQAIELQRSLAAAQLDAMRMKLHPHFLFNTLNTIASLARAGETDAVGQVVERLERSPIVDGDQRATTGDARRGVSLSTSTWPSRRFVSRIVSTSFGESTPRPARRSCRT
jgi:hypothetical protein